MTKKTILLTGCTRGLGAAMTAHFIARGHRVAGCGRNTTALESLRTRHGAPHLFSAADLREETDVEAFCRDTVQELGVPDLVINNGAVINRNAPLWEITAEEIDEVIDINVKGVVHVVRHILPAMAERGSGVIVNFSSGWGRSASPDVAPYCASKWAIEGLTAALAQELPEGLAAVALNPGIIDTDMLRSCFGEGAATYPTPDSWARATVPFLEELGPSHNGRQLTAPVA